MKNGTPDVEPAPAAVLRAAAWPIESLDGFGDPDLARSGLEVRGPDDDAWDRYLARWRATLDGERERLWSLTAGDPWFMKALMLSNPTLARRVRVGMARKGGPRTKRVRHLEETLYRCLARAAGRTTPLGLWAGVAMVELGDRPAQEPVPARYDFTPDLRPFQAVLLGLSRRHPYRERAHWHVNPTLERLPEGSWRFLARKDDGTVECRSLDHEEDVAALLRSLESVGRGTLAGLAAHVAQAPEIRPMLEALVDGGVLVGGLDLPGRFQNAWEALARSSEWLETADSERWVRTVGGLRDICAFLSRELEAITLQELELHLGRCRDAVLDLARGLGIPVPVLPDPVLRCDLGVPFRVTCGAEQKRRIVEALGAYQRCWVDGVSPGTAHRDRRRRSRPDGSGSGGASGIAADLLPHRDHAPLRWEDLGSNQDPIFAERLAALSSYLSQPLEEVVLPDPGPRVPPPPHPPFGCLHAGVLDGFRLTVHGLSDDPAPAMARYSGVLAGSGRLEGWIARHLDDLSARHGIAIAELVTPCEENPNALAGRRYRELLIEPWGTVADSHPLRGARVGPDPQTGLPFLWIPSVRQPIAVFWFASADVTAADPVARRILQTSFHDAPGAEFRASALAVGVEVDTPRFTPRIRLPGGALLRPRRTFVTGALLEELARVSPPERFARWQKLAARFGWPTRLKVAVAHAPALPVPRDSPLAVESLFKGVRGRAPWLMVEEMPGVPWLETPDGRHYEAEIVLPFFRAGHGWSGRVPVLDEQPRSG